MTDTEWEEVPDQVPDENPTKAYLGDSVYVKMEYNMVVLTTENGIDISNRVCLEPEVYSALTRWMERREGR